MPKKYTVVAIVYDFDGTLAKGNIQDNSFIPSIEIKRKENFWDDVHALSKKDDMDEILAYMFLLITKASENGKVKFGKKALKEHGKKARYFDGVEDYFDRINQYAKAKEIKLEHYIISSGTKEMLEGTTIAKQFKKIYASSFKYDQNDIPVWPAIAINYTTKTQFLFRINKGIEEIWDNTKINEYIPKEERRIPFENMIYIGDGNTDVPAMKLVKMQGGTSIGVYEPNTSKEGVHKLLKQDRISYSAKADYQDQSELDVIIKTIVDKISATASIKKFAKKYKKTIC